MRILRQYIKNEQKDVLNNDFLSDQISPYIVSNLKIYPKPAEFKLYFDSDDLHSKNEFDMTYKGGYYNNANGVVNYQLSFLVKKFNYDVENKIYLSFYAPKQSLQFVNITLSQNENYPCPNNCSGHGICRTNVCQCVNEVNNKLILSIHISFIQFNLF